VETRKLIDVLKTRLATVSAEVEALRARADSSAAVELQSVNIQQLLQRQEEEDSLKLLALLQQQEKVWEAVTADKLAEQSERLAAQHAEAARALTAELQQVLRPSPSPPLRCPSPTPHLRLRLCAPT
jgi:hypothetical protein